jgi:hypothetical protein
MSNRRGPSIYDEKDFKDNKLFTIDTTDTEGIQPIGKEEGVFLVKFSRQLYGELIALGQYNPHAVDFIELKALSLSLGRTRETKPMEISDVIKFAMTTLSLNALLKEEKIVLTEFETQSLGLTIVNNRDTYNTIVLNEMKKFQNNQKRDFNFLETLIMSKVSHKYLDLPKPQEKVLNDLSAKIKQQEGNPQAINLLMNVYFQVRQADFTNPESIAKLKDQLQQLHAQGASRELSGFSIFKDKKDSKENAIGGIIHNLDIQLLRLFAEEKNIEVKQIPVQNENKEVFADDLEEDQVEGGLEQLEGPPLQFEGPEGEDEVGIEGLDQLEEELEPGLELQPELNEEELQPGLDPQLKSDPENKNFKDQKPFQKDQKPFQPEKNFEQKKLESRITMLVIGNREVKGLISELKAKTPSLVKSLDFDNFESIIRLVAEVQNAVDQDKNLNRDGRIGNFLEAIYQEAQKSPSIQMTLEKETSKLTQNNTKKWSPFG